MKAVLAAALLPYTLNVSGQGPFHAKAGVPSCLAAALDDLERQRSIVQRACARDGGELKAGKLVSTLVEGVHCTASAPLTCDLPGRAERPEPDGDGPKA